MESVYRLLEDYRTSNLGDNGQTTRVDISFSSSVNCKMLGIISLLATPWLEQITEQTAFMFSGRHSLEADTVSRPRLTNGKSSLPSVHAESAAEVDSYGIHGYRPASRMFCVCQRGCWTGQACQSRHGT